MKDKLTRIAPILLIIVIAVLAIAALVSLGQMFFGEDSQDQTDKPQQAQTVDVSANLLKNTTDRSVRMTVRGPIVADENFRSYTVNVSPTTRTLTTYKGYKGEVIDNNQLDNNTKAYDEFVAALNKANMMKGDALTGEADNMNGVCASGHTYDFAILKNGEIEKHLWTSTCDGSKGSLKANVRQLQTLFINQIPNNNKIVNDLGMSKI